MKFLYWIPRVLSIFFILFISLFALDSFDSGFNLMTFLGFLIHLTPSFLMIIFLYISWKYELVGGIFFIFLGLIYIAFTLFNAPFLLALSWSMFIALPCFIIGALYLYNWWKRESENKFKKKVKKR